MAIPVNFDLESPAWLRNLRWAAIAGMAAAVLGAKMLGAQLPLWPIFLFIGALGVWNLFLPAIEDRFFATSKGFVFLQMIVDVVALTGVLWFSGGLVNPFIEFYVLHVIVAGLLLNSVLTMAVSLFAAFCVVFLIFAPALQVGTQLIELRSSPIWFGLPIGIILLIGITSGFILVFLGRLGRAQDQLRHRIKMEALGRLVAGLAHEIGTPLNSILVLAKEMESSVGDEQQKELKIIGSQARRCGEIVSLLLGYSRTLVRNSEDVKYTSVALVKWVEDTYHLLVQAESKRYPGRVRPNITFSVQAKGLPESVKVPELILRQVLENLLKNARDALGNIPEPKIQVEIYVDETEDELVIVVNDNGQGFSKEEKEKAFEAFFSTKDPGLGSGLGLYISYYLLTQVGGRIVIEDGSGPGARMLVALPRLDGLDDQA